MSGIAMVSSMLLLILLAVYAALRIVPPLSMLFVMMSIVPWLCASQRCGLLSEA